MITYILAFFAVGLLDFIWAIYTRKVTAGHALHAGLYASVIFAVNAYVVDSFIKDNAVVIPAVMGAFVGTYAAITWDKRRKRDV